MDTSNMVIATPDTGGTKRANAYASTHRLTWPSATNSVKWPTGVKSMTVIGDVAGKDVASSTTWSIPGHLAKAADMMMEHGAKSGGVFHPQPGLRAHR